jgi:hypothetical protein
MKEQDEIPSEITEEFRHDGGEVPPSSVKVPKVEVQRSSQVELERRRH